MQNLRILFVYKKYYGGDSVVFFLILRSFDHSVKNGTWDRTF